jgi:hypothetical protein
MNTTKEDIPTDIDYKYQCLECNENPTERHTELFHANLEKEALFYAYKTAEEFVLLFAKIAKGPLLRYIQQCMDTLADNTRKLTSFSEMKQCSKIINNYVSELAGLQQRNEDNEDSGDISMEESRDVDGLEKFEVLNGVSDLLLQWKSDVDERIRSYKQEEKQVISNLSTVLSTTEEATQNKQFLLIRSLDINLLCQGLQGAIKQFDSVLTPPRDVKDELKAFMLALEWIQLLYQVCMMNVCGSMWEL